MPRAQDDGLRLFFRASLCLSVRKCLSVRRIVTFALDRHPASTDNLADLCTLWPSTSALLSFLINDGKQFPCSWYPTRCFPRNDEAAFENPLPDPTLFSAGRHGICHDTNYRTMISALSFLHLGYRVWPWLNPRARKTSLRKR